MFTQVAENLFTLEKELRFSFGMTLLTRMSIVRRGRDLWVHSPLPGPDWYEAIGDLGEVRFLVAPSCYHCSFISAAKQRFPQAVLAAPPQLATSKPNLATELVLAADAPDHEGWPSDVLVIPVQGAPKTSEHLFYDRQSRSLIVTDLIFDNERGANWVTRALLGVFAPTGRPARSKEWDWWLIKDKDAFSKSLDVLNTLPIDRVLGAHGRIIDDVPLALSLMQTGKPPTEPI
jgi:hypothetical protein